MDSTSSTPIPEAGPRNPFAMLLDLDRVVHDMEHSERLQRLERHVVHPLDQLATRSKVADYDKLIDEAPDEAAPPEDEEGIQPS
ncbi:hypothetical protein [Pelomonas sp. KK5]|uniref:hypothetical protein n=1 Tax=Pelomonas sp. KK5 TaxID=1855730 RepID=UPI00097C99F0|nr:hypothetical protein [Pelomonas sp. KK5]